MRVSILLIMHIADSYGGRSNDYSKNEDSTSPLKGMLLNKVVVGLGYKLTENDSSLTKPRDGYDSVRTHYFLMLWGCSLL